jgi:hypothetical protein
MIKLPENLEKDYEEINSIFYDIRLFNPIKDEDEYLPKDKHFEKRIINFLINLTQYFLDNFEKLNLDECKEFLANYRHNFLYGPFDFCYLVFGDLDGETIYDFSLNLEDEKIILTKEYLIELNQKYKQILNQYT